MIACDRFWEKVQYSPGCWEWTASRDQAGYGLFKLTTDTLKRAHRLVMGDPDGCVLHRCDNPPCVNPLHLYVGTKKDNAGDRESRGRGVVPRLKGEGHPQCKLTDGQAEQIKALAQKGTVSQRRIAAMFGISQAHVSEIKNGRKRNAGL